MSAFRRFLPPVLVCFIAIALAGCKGGSASDPFAPGLPAYIVAGTVTGAWAEGVTITFSSADTTTVTTNASGVYQLSTFSTGTYTVTPSLAGYTFTPIEQTIFLSRETTTLSNTVFLGDFVSASSLTSYSISGSISYSGSYSGPNTGIYIGLWKDGQPTGRGTSIASAGTYTIRGIPAGTYTVNAEMDILGAGTRNATNPYGTLPSVSVNDNLTGQDITLGDAAVAPTTPTGLTINPGNQSAIVAWTGNYDASGNETATAYTLYSGPAGSSPTDRVVVPAYGRQIYFKSLPDGVYSFMIASLVGALESAASAVVGPVTIGARSGANTVSGTIKIPSTPTGPLYAGVYDGNNHFYFDRIESPSQSQTYSVSGVPDGAYQFFAAVDMDNDGFLDAGDLSIGMRSTNQLIVVNGADRSWDAVLPDQNSVITTNTNHYRWQTGPDTNDYYSLKFQVDGNKKRPVNVVLISGPNVPVPLDIMRPSLGNPMAFSTWVKSGVTGTAMPAPGDIYTYKVAYSDGTAETLSSVVTAVLGTESFAQSLNVQSNPSSTVPTFNWAAPASPPASYTYAVEVLPLNNSWYWLYPKNVSGMPSSVTTVQFNVDAQQGVPASLTINRPYMWTVFVMDGNGNAAQVLSSYVP